MTSLQCKCQTVDDRSGRPDDTQAKKKTKTPKKKESKKEQSESLCSEIPEWLQEFKANLVDDEIPEHGDSHASSSHEPSLEPTPASSVDLGKHSVETHFPNDRNCVICQRTKITRARAEDALAESYFVQKFLVIGQQQITKFSVTIANLETFTDMQSWCRT